MNESAWIRARESSMSRWWMRRRLTPASRRRTDDRWRRLWGLPRRSAMDANWRRGWASCRGSALGHEALQTARARTVVRSEVGSDGGASRTTRQESALDKGLRGRLVEAGTRNPPGLGSVCFRREVEYLSATDPCSAMQSPISPRRLRRRAAATRRWRSASSSGLDTPIAGVMANIERRMRAQRQIDACSTDTRFGIGMGSLSFRVNGRAELTGGPS